MNNLIIYSWNVLNPSIYINYKLWENIFNKQSHDVAKMDYKRYFHFRKNAIIEIINHWLNDENVIICLQEINRDLLAELQTNCKYHIFNSEFYNNDCRVTIVKGFDDVISSDISININNITKNCLKTVIDNKIEIFNIHLHWKWTIDNIIQVANIIEENMKHEYFIICGDMNKSLTEMQPFLDTLDCLLINDIDKSDFTSINPSTSKYDIIDHIFISPNIQPITNINIINKILKYKIIYEITKIYDLFKKYNKISYKIWLNKRLNRDISDHKPIKLIVKF